MLPVDDRTVLHMLRALQVLRSSGSRSFADARSLSYQALDVEQIGYVYEGLLDHTAKRVEHVSLIFAGQADVVIELKELVLAASRSQAEVIALIQERVGGGLKKIEQTIGRSVDPTTIEELLGVCDGDRELAQKAAQFAPLLDRDLWGRPAVLLSGSYVVVKGNERRTSGTHYTPVSLTEAMVRETLEPVVYEGPSEGRPRQDWKLKIPDEILNLKIS